MRPLIAILVATLMLGLDQLSKKWALFMLGEAGATIHLPGPIDLTLVFNRSTAFGLAPVAGQFTRWGLTIFGAGVTLILIETIIRHPMSRLQTLGLAFIAAGAAGNALDRSHYGAVVDFLDASKIGFVWVFNPADAALDIGIGLSIFAMLVQPRQAETEPPTAHDGSPE